MRPSAVIATVLHMDAPRALTCSPLRRRLAPAPKDSRAARNFLFSLDQTSAKGHSADLWPCAFCAPVIVFGRSALRDWPRRRLRTAGTAQPRYGRFVTPSCRSRPAAFEQARFRTFPFMSIGALAAEANQFLARPRFRKLNTPIEGCSWECLRTPNINDACGTERLRCGPSPKSKVPDHAQR